MRMRRHEGRWLLCALACALFGCGQDKPPPRRSTPETNAPATAAAEPAAQPAPQQPEAPALPPAPDPPGERAYAHYDAARQASDAILQADLSAAAPHLGWLAHYAYPSKLPHNWQPYAARIQLAARVLARAATPGEAMRALPALDAACGPCHAELGGKDWSGEKAASHAEGAYALRTALVGPSDTLFALAAAATPRIKDADKADDAALKALQEGSARAAKATTWVERLAATQELYAQCGGCHVSLR